MIDLGKFNLLGVNINAIDYESAVARIVDHAQSGQSLGVSALAVHGVMTGVLDKEHRHRLNSLELILPDGQPVRWGVNWLHKTHLKDRVYGPKLMLETCRTASQLGLPIFLFGCTESTLQSLSRTLRERFPELQIAGTRPSQFRNMEPDEKRDVVREIRESGAKITFVGIGCPRQEVWTYEFKEELQMPVVAVGAAFAFHAGELPQAPRWMQRSGLEWLFRLIKEPRRLWQRYLLLNPYYLWLVLMQRTGMKQFNVANTTPPKGEVLYG